MRIKTVSLNRQLVILTLIRWLDSVAYRMVYPFLPDFARGLGISIEQITLAISVRSAFGILGPVLGFLSDLRGRRTALLYGLLLFSVGMGLITIWPTFPIFFSGLLLSTIGGIIIEATIHAYLGDQVPYQKRGRAIAIVELGWSASFILGIPILGWFISRSGWSSPFIWLAFVGLVCIVLIWRILPSSVPAFRKMPSVSGGLRLVFSQPNVALALVFGLLVVIANQLITIIFGVWMEDSFHLLVAEKGFASSIIGVAEILGTVLVALFTDRLGIRRAICLGLFVNSVACLLIPISKTNLVAALVILFFFFHCQCHRNDPQGIGNLFTILFYKIHQYLRAG